MKTWLKRLGLIMLVIVVGVAVALYQGDVPKEVVDAKYSSAASQFLEMPSGARIHYRDEGLSDGRAVVLVHGANASLHTWEPWVKILGDRYRLITLDLPAHGLTGKVPDRDYSNANQLAVVDAVVEHLEVDRFVLGGNSMGGGVTWRYTMEHPEKVEAMILVDAVGLPQWSAQAMETASQNKNKGPLIFRLMQKRWFRAIARYIDPYYFTKQGLQSAYTDQLAVTEALIQRYYDLALREGSREAIMDRFSNMSSEAEETLVDPAQFSQPTIVLWGRDDALIPVAVGNKFASEFSEATLIVYDDVGHLPMEEVPNRSGRDVLKFLEQLEIEPVAAEPFAAEPDGATSAE